MRTACATAVIFFCAGSLAPAAARPVHAFLEVALAPDGQHVASVEGDQTPSGEVDIKRVVIRAADGSAERGVALPCAGAADCTPSSLAWAPDGRVLFFVLRQPGGHAHAIYKVGLDGGYANEVLAFDGTLGGLTFGPHGELAVLAVAGADKEVGAVEAGAPAGGVLGSDPREQRIAIVQPDGTLRFASPANLFVYEYDWLPDGSGFVGTAAPGNGDNNWWSARLYGFSRTGAGAREIFAPPSPSLQIAAPHVSPDGKQVAFIGGIMSDFGATGGDLYVVPASGGAARDITPEVKASVMSVRWSCDGASLITTELADDTLRIGAWPQAGGAEKVLSAGQEMLGGFFGVGFAASCGTETTAAVRQSFVQPPEIMVGKLGAWHALTRANAGLGAPAEARSLHWTKEGWNEQGWLLLPTSLPAGGKLPMITVVHGGPAWANVPFYVGDGMERRLLAAGYGLFLPNPRGSYGQGEAFTRANMKDFGGGDLRDILAGVDAAVSGAKIDGARLGIMGWSYGGFMTMWAVTQTDRFRAAVAGAGLANWQSYYGENGIDGWMIPYFGASVYDDPAVYAKSSPINYVKHVKTPTLMVVGADDIECPAPQTLEFWHALNDLGVTTEGVVYPGEGHWMHDPKHVADFEDRAVAWFQKYLK